jgi:hypothetical protein
MIKRLFEYIGISIFALIQIVVAIAGLIFVLWFNYSCFVAPVVSVVNQIIDYSDEDIKEYNEENKDSFMYRDGEEIIEIPTPEGYTKVIDDSFKIRSFKGEFLRQGQENLQFYVKEDQYQILLDSDTREDYLYDAIVLQKSTAIEEMGAVTKGLFDDMFKLLTKGTINHQKMMYLDLLSTIEDAEIEKPKVEVKLKEPIRVNENFFYQSVEIIMEKDSKMSSSNCVTGMLFVNDCFVSYRIENEGFNKLSTLEDIAVQWAKIIYEEND